MDYIIAKKTGRSANGFERDHGMIFHALPVVESSKLFAAKTLCGTQPGRRSDWSQWKGHALHVPNVLRRSIIRRRHDRHIHNATAGGLAQRRN
jgi:hypothetical protein